MMKTLRASLFLLALCGLWSVGHAETRDIPPPPPANLDGLGDDTPAQGVVASPRNVPADSPLAANHTDTSNPTLAGTAPDAAPAAASVGTAEQAAGPQASSLGAILNEAVGASDELNIIRARIDQAKAMLRAAHSAYLPQATVTERFGRDIANPSSARSPGDPRGTSEYVNANSTKLEITQMVFDGFKTPAQIESQRQTLKALEFRYTTTRNTVVGDTLDVYLTAWHHLQAMKAGVALVEDLKTLQHKVALQAEAGAADQTVKSYVDSRLTGATQELLKTRNAYREALFRLSYLMQRDIAPEAFGFPPLLAPALQDLDSYMDSLSRTNPELLEQQANQLAAKQDLRKARAAFYPTLSLTSDMQDTNDLGGSVGTVRTANAMVQLSYKLFDGFAARNSAASAAGVVTENRYRTRRLQRQLEQDLAQAWRKATASNQEAKLARDEAQASLKVKVLRGQDVENGQGDIVRLIEAEETLYTALLRQLDTLQAMAQKRYEVTLSSGKLGDLACVDGGCPELPMELMDWTDPTSPPAALPEAASTEQSTVATVSGTLPQAVSATLPEAANETVTPTMPKDVSSTTATTGAENPAPEVSAPQPDAKPETAAPVAPPTQPEETAKPAPKPERAAAEEENLHDPEAPPEPAK